MITPPRSAPDFALTAPDGRTVRLRSLRGRAVVLSFLYTHCPDVCPVIAAALRRAVTLLGTRAGRVRLVAVSVDPARDTPVAIRAFLAAHRLTGRLLYLRGDLRALRPVWRRYGVAVVPARASRVSAAVGHSAVVLGITASGRELAVYSADRLDPAAIAHDVPLLAAR